MNSYKLYLILVVLYVLLTSCETRYYFVRHAEKACEDCVTCGLTSDGNLRAIALMDTLINKKIDTIFASQCLRTRLTARPLADRLGKSISIYQTNQLNNFINNLKKFSSNKSLLIVGHSDQIPVMIDSLAHRHVVIGNNDYDNLFVLTKTNFFGTRITFRATTYGFPTP